MTATEVASSETKTVGEISLSKENINKTPDEDRKAEALEYLMDGKRNLLCKDIPAAVSSLADACEVLSAECGEKAPECGEAYYFYGKALLEMGRLENVVLGNALAGVPEGEDVNASPQVEDPDKVTDEERATVEAKVDEALEENFDSCEKAEAPLLTMEVEGVEASLQTMEVEGSGVVSASDDLVKDGEDKTKDVEENQDDEGLNSEEECDHPDEKEAAAVHEAKAGEEPSTSTLQLAWEVLELSKLICKEQMEGEKANAALEKRVCDTYVLLSEVSVESGNYGQAVEDLKVCLEKQKVILPADCRSIAETHYRLGVALGFQKNYDEAIASLEAAVSVLNKCLAISKEKSGTESKMEIVAIKALVPEVLVKIADLKEMKVGHANDASEINGGTSLDNSKPVTGIAVKRKSDEGLSEDAKKIKA